MRPVCGIYPLSPDNKEPPDAVWDVGCRKGETFPVRAIPRLVVFLVARAAAMVFQERQDTGNPELNASRRKIAKATTPYPYHTGNTCGGIGNIPTRKGPSRRTARISIRLPA